MRLRDAILSKLSLKTRRLRLVASTLSHVEAELEGRESLRALLRVAIPPSWPPGEYDRDALEFFRSRLQAGGPSHAGWYGWYAIAPAAEGGGESLVAAAGYLGPPSLGAVEIGFSVIPEARGRGYATEIAEALVVHAFEQPTVQIIVARTTDSNVPSTKVLLRCGFHRMGSEIEPGIVEYQRQLGP